MILIIADEDNNDAWLVKRNIEEYFGQRVLLFNFNLNDIKFELSINNKTDKLYFYIHDKKYSLTDFEAVWFTTCFLPEELKINHIINADDIDYQIDLYTHYKQELKVLSYFILNKITIEVPRRLGSPFFDEINKLNMLADARSTGLKIPSTFVTNHKHFIEKKILEEENTYIAKTMFAPFVFENKSQFYFTPTVRLNKEHVLKELNEFFFPGILQHEIDSKVELKIVYVSGIMFACCLHKTKEDKDPEIQDLKMLFDDKNKNNYSRFDLPEYLQDQIHSFMNKQNANFGVLDFILNSASGELIFLEFNPYGVYSNLQWGCSYNINYTIAEYLCQTN